ncbi:hypothetical protein H9Q09_01005 [Aurantimonas sp. DM33-3]|uniref:hypothetical protein n=1 Tax=Aurantimonas sp. DM33-3 TaxID=2766955 RepID=UPI00165249B8|nr:hypothetical protein [Aurantimonas sp. DM33-3]MBC6714763.1 hypothetical protein [Aurantimonas sp. DM33-3]
MKKLLLAALLGSLSAPALAADDFPKAAILIGTVKALCPGEITEEVWMRAVEKSAEAQGKSVSTTLSETAMMAGNIAGQFSSSGNADMICQQWRNAKN